MLREHQLNADELYKRLKSKKRQSIPSHSYFTLHLGAAVRERERG